MLKGKSSPFDGTWMVVRSSRLRVIVCLCLVHRTEQVFSLLQLVVLSC
jgi:hypothetical protein